MEYLNIKYYEEYDEENRLVKDNAHRVEFDTTIHALKKYIDPNAKILDVGAGTGRYSFYFANIGCNVYAMDLVQKHIDIMNIKLANCKSLQLNVSQGDALDLSRFPAEEFDVVLCMGPMYHLTNENERTVCLQECKRVLRSKGIIAIAYINNEFIQSYDVQNPYFIGLDPICIINKLKELDFIVEDHLATDGITPNVSRFVNSLDREEYNDWLDFHIKMSRKDASIKNTLHALVIAQKP